MKSKALSPSRTETLRTNLLSTPYLAILNGGFTADVKPPLASRTSRASPAPRQQVPGQPYPVLNRRKEGDASQRSVPARRSSPLPSADRGVQIVPNAADVHLEALQPGQSGWAAASVNHLCQGTVLLHETLPGAALGETADLVAQVCGVEMRSHLATGNIVDDPQFAEHLHNVQVVGSALFELGNASTIGGQMHQLTLIHMSGRGNSLFPAGLWVVEDPGIPSREVPATVAVFPTPIEALQYVSVLNAVFNEKLPVLKMAYPKNPLPPLAGARGLYLPREGFVTSQLLTAAEHNKVRRDYGVQLLASSRTGTLSSATAATLAATSAPSSSSGTSSSEPVTVASIQHNFPRAANEFQMDYAKRIFAMSLDDHAGVRIGRKVLNCQQLHQISGVSKPRLRRVIKFGVPSEALKRVLTDIPRGPNEPPRDYARRLYRSGVMGVLAAQVDGQPISPAQVSQLVDDLSDTDAVADPYFRLVTPQAIWQLEAISALPQYVGPPDVTSKIKHAKWLYRESRKDKPHLRIDGQPLTVTHVAILSNTYESNLRNDPAFHVWTPQEHRDLDPILAEFPPTRNPMQHARLLLEASQNNDKRAQVNGRELTPHQLALLSGVPLNRIRDHLKYKVSYVEYRPPGVR